MKTFTYFLVSCLLALSLMSCNREAPTVEFKKMAELEMGNITKDYATLRGTAVFLNLSDQKYTLKDMTLDYTIDGKDIGTIVVKKDKVILPNSEFSIPIKYNYPTAEFVEPGHDPSSLYALQLIGSITVEDSEGNEIVRQVKFAESYEFQTKKEERLEKRELRKEEREKRRDEKRQQKDVQ